jgi:hypothetical protein
MPVFQHTGTSLFYEIYIYAESIFGICCYKYILNSGGGGKKFRGGAAV